MIGQYFNFLSLSIAIFLDDRIDCDDSYIHSRCVNTSPKEKHATNYGYHCSGIPVMEEGVELN